MKPVQKEGQTNALGQKVENCDQCFLNKTGISKRFGFSILGGRFLDSFVVRFQQPKPDKKREKSGLFGHRV